MIVMMIMILIIGTVMELRILVFIVILSRKGILYFGVISGQGPES